MSWEWRGGVLLLLLFVAAAISFTCAGSEDEAGDDDEVDCPTYEDLDVGEIDEEPATPACDFTCLDRMYGWQGECMQEYADCWDGCGTISCTEDCAACADECLDNVHLAAVACADLCDGCLRDNFTCETGCDSSSCLEECTATFFACNEWNLDCWNNCQQDYNACLDDTLNGEDLLACFDANVACMKSCYE